MKSELGPTSKCNWLAAGQSTGTMGRSGQGRTCLF